jgi:hypothetical protein
MKKLGGCVQPCSHTERATVLAAQHSRQWRRTKQGGISTQHIPAARMVALAGCTRPSRQIGRLCRGYTSLRGVLKHASKGCPPFKVIYCSICCFAVMSQWNSVTATEIAGVSLLAIIEHEFVWTAAAGCMRLGTPQAHTGTAVVCPRVKARRVRVEHEFTSVHHETFEVAVLDCSRLLSLPAMALRTCQRWPASRSLGASKCAMSGRTARSDDDHVA